MTALPQLHWPLVAGLGAFALVRPLSRIVAEQLGLPESPWFAVGTTVAVTLVWVAVVGLGRVAQPVLTLVAAGVAYGVFSILLSAVAAPVLTGQLQGPLATPIAVVPILLFNALWGLIAGALALLVARTRTRASR